MMVMTMIWYDNILVNCLLQSSCLCLCVCVCLLSFHTLSDLFGCPISCTIFNLIPNIVQYVCSLECIHIHIYIYSPSSQWMSRLNQCLKLPLSLTNLWYIKKKNATFVVQYVLFTRCRLCHTHYMHFTTDEDRQSHTNKLFVCVGTSSDTGINHQYTNGWKLWFAMGFYRIVNRTKCITL